MFLLFALQEHLLAFKCLATIFVQHSFLIRQRWFVKLWLFEAAIETLERQSICAKKRIEPLWSAFIVCSLSWRRHLSIDDKWRVLFLLVAWRYHETLVAWSLQVFLNKNNGEFPLIFQRFFGIDRGLLETRVNRNMSLQRYHEKETICGFLSFWKPTWRKRENFG